MSTVRLCRGVLRRSAVPLGLSLSTGIFLVSRQKPMLLEAMPSRSSSPVTSRAIEESTEWLDPEVIRQLSGGSLAGEKNECLPQGSQQEIAILTTQNATGFVTGVLVSFFSKTLVLLTGIAIVAIQVSRLPWVPPGVKC